MAAWDKLPNAALINRVLASVRQHPGLWRAAWDAAWDAAWSAARDAAWAAARAAARDAAWDAAWDAARDAAWAAARDAARNAAWAAAWGAIAALVAFDESADILRLPPDAVRAMAGWRVPAAVLLAPYIHLIQQEE